MEGNRSKLQEIAGQYGPDETIPLAQELLDRLNAFEKAKNEFVRPEKRFLTLKQGL